MRLRRKKKAMPLPAIPPTPPPPVSCTLRARAFLESSTVRYNLVLEGSIFPRRSGERLKGWITAGVFPKLLEIFTVSVPGVFSSRLGYFSADVCMPFP